MRRALYILVVAALAVAAAWWLATLPGVLTLAVGEYGLSAPVPVVVVGTILLFAILYGLVRLLGGMVRLPRTWRRWRSARHRRHGDRAVTRALVALAAGEGAEARREAVRARRHLGDTPLALLLVSEAARLARRPAEMEEALLLLTNSADASFLGLRGLLRAAMQRADWPEAARLAREAERAHPGALWVAEERVQLAIRTQNWEDALALAVDDGSRAAFATMAAEKVAAEGGPSPELALRLARAGFEADPALPPAALTYARLLRVQGHETRAQNVIRKAWAAGPAPDLADFFLAPVQEKLARVHEAERLAQANPAHVESHLLMARTSLAADLYGEARRHLAAARATGSNERRLWVLQADIEEAEYGTTEEGRAAQRDALRAANSADPDPVWRCGACSGTQDRWQPVCPMCGHSGTLHWAKAAQPADQSGRLVVDQPAGRGLERNIIGP